MISIHTNLSALVAQRNLKSSTDLLNQAIERMTTGFKINGAKDNAANYAISTQMTTKISSFDIAEDNTLMSLDMVTTASESLNLLQDRIQRLRDLHEQALNGTYGQGSLNAINAECNALVDEINRLYLTTEYNGINLFLETTTSDEGELEILQEVSADLETTFEELGITASSFSVYDKENNLIQTYDVDGENTVDDLFSTLATHNILGTITTGRIELDSSAGNYVAGALMDELGITTTDKTYVESSSQTSAAPVTYESVTSSTTESIVETTTTTSTTQTLTIWETTTTSTTITETIWTTTTSSTTQTMTIWETLTTPTTQTLTIWETTTSSTTQTVTLWETTTTSTTVTETIWTTTTSSTTLTETIWTTTTTSSTLTETITVESTIGTNSTSSSTITYKHTSSYNSYSVDETAAVGITVKGWVEQKINDGDPYGSASTYTIEATYCETFEDLMELVGATAYSDSMKANSNGAYIYSYSYDIDYDYTDFYLDYTDSNGNSYTKEKYFDAPNAITTIPASYTTTSIATSATKLSTIGISSSQYITVQSNGTETIITCKTSDTIGSIITKLTSAGITASLSNGILSVSGTETAYISGMSELLKKTFLIDGNFTSIKTTSTTQTETIWTTTTTSTTETQTVWQTTTSSTTQAETLWATTTTSTTETQTVWETTTSSTTQTETIYTTTTSSVTQTETIWETTTSSTTQTETAYVTTTTSTTETQTLWETTTTSSTQTLTIWTTTTELATGDTTFDVFGLRNNFTVTLNQDGTKNVLNLSNTMTIDEFVNELNAQGFVADFTNHKLTINAIGDSYISNKSLENAFKILFVNRQFGERKVNTDSDYQTYEKNILPELGNIYAPGRINLQIGVNNDENSKLSVQTSFSLVGYNDFRQIGANDVNYLEQLDELLNSLTAQQAEFGAVQNRLESVLEEITIQRENLVSSRSTLRDADIAEETSTYIMQQILQQASATLLSTANQTPAIALQLL